MEGYRFYLLCNASVRIEDLGKIWLLGLDQFLQFCYLSNLLEGKDLILPVAVYGEASRVVPSVFEPGKAIDEGI